MGKRDTGFLWDIKLPDRKQATLGQLKPRAKLVIQSEINSGEELQIPVQVAKKLLYKDENDLIHPQSRAELLYLLNSISVECAWTRVIGLIDRRDYSSEELKHKLKLDGYTSSVIEQTVERARTSSFVDDKRFADVFIRSKKASGWGKNKIDIELGRRGIDTSTLEGWPDLYFDNDSEYERAVEILSKKRLSGKNDYQKLVRFLTSRGFSLSISQSAVRQRLENSF